MLYYLHTDVLSSMDHNILSVYYAFKKSIVDIV